MKTIRLSKLLLVSALFLSVGFTTAYTEDMKCGAGKCGASMNTKDTKKVEKKNKKWNPKKVDDAKNNYNNYYNNQNQMRQNSNQKYEKGTIQTH